MRIAILYDCLYPNTIGGAERWYRSLAESLERAGHEVTYLTRRQWGAEGPQTSFRTIAVSRRDALYTDSGRRKVGPPLRYGWGVFWHLLRHGGRYDAVHTDVFPYFSVIGAWLALRLRPGRKRPRMFVDWFELWTRSYWVDYLGGPGGRVGYLVQKLCTRLPDRSFVFSNLHARRLAEEGHRAPVTRLTGIFQAPDPAPEPLLERGDAPPLVVFAGRHIAEKQVPAIPPAIAELRRKRPDLRCVILGDGPEREAVEREITRLGLGDAIELPGRVPFEQVQQTIAGASCLLLPSVREGYGLVVIEATAVGTPAVVVAGDDNAATELIDVGVNGFVAADASPAGLADAIGSAIDGGDALRASTLAWYREHERALSVDAALETVVAAYGDDSRADVQARR